MGDKEFLFLSHISNTSIDYWLKQTAKECAIAYSKAIEIHKELNKTPS